MPIDYGIRPDMVADMVIKAIAANQLYIFTHGEYAKPLAARHERMQAAMAETPVSAFYDPASPLPGTPEWAAYAAQRS